MPKTDFARGQLLSDGRRVAFGVYAGKMRLHLGYRTAQYRGMQLKGHEFHYSSVIQPDLLPSEVSQYNVKGALVDTPLYRYKNVIAGYTHWYWGENDFLNCGTKIHIELCENIYPDRRRGYDRYSWRYTRAQG